MEFSAETMFAISNRCPSTCRRNIVGEDEVEAVGACDVASVVAVAVTQTIRRVSQIEDFVQGIEFIITLAFHQSITDIYLGIALQILMVDIHVVSIGDDIAHALIVGDMNWYGFGECTS